MRFLRIITLATAVTLSSIVAFSSGTATVSVREYLRAIPVSDQLGGDTTRPLETPDAFSFEAANAPREHQRIFSFGNRLFNTNWVEAPASVKSFDGLGPLFNRVSCSGCHTKDGRGQPPENGQGPMDSMLLRISIPGFGPKGGPNPVPNYGDQLSERSINGVDAEGLASVSYVETSGKYADGEAYSLRSPTFSIRSNTYGTLPRNLMISPRVAPQMIGLGLLEAVPAETMQALADPEDKDGDGISGRLNVVWDSARNQMATGRFGWKAGQPDLTNQNAAAALGDIGLTTGVHPRENCTESQTTCSASINGGTPELSAEFLEKLTLYTASLAVPAQRNAKDATVTQGGKTFQDFGCAACHLPTLQSGAHPLPEVANQTFHPYTDLLLHDMGKALADNRPDFSATGQEWRTPPLWGLGLVPKVNDHDTLLHDGRARGFAEAILWHGGEAETAKEKFRTAPRSARDAMLKFLKSL
jgi:CxxC motif-containing protein (DUF1111 family)